MDIAAADKFVVEVPNHATFVKVCQIIGETIGNEFLFTYYPAASEIQLYQMDKARAALNLLKYKVKQVRKDASAEKVDFFVKKKAFLDTLSAVSKEGTLWISKMGPDLVCVFTITTDPNGKPWRQKFPVGINDAENNTGMVNRSYDFRFTLSAARWKSYCNGALQSSEKKLQILRYEDSDSMNVVFRYESPSKQGQYVECIVPTSEAGQSSKEEPSEEKNMAGNFAFLFDTEEFLKKASQAYNKTYLADVIYKFVKRLDGNVVCHLGEDVPLYFEYDLGIKGSSFSYFVAPTIDEEL